MRVSRIEISNFRNFEHLDIRIGEHCVIVGENKSGKTNLLHGLRLLLDPTLPDSYRYLTEDDFWDGLDQPFYGNEITVSIEFMNFEHNKLLLSLLSDCLVEIEPQRVARLTYKYAPRKTVLSPSEATQTEYEFIIFGGEDEASRLPSEFRRWIPLEVLHALRDAESDLSSWRRSPLRPLIEKLSPDLESLEQAAEEILTATETLLNLPEVDTLQTGIQDRIEQVIGALHSVDPTLGVSALRHQDFSDRYVYF